MENMNVNEITNKILRECLNEGEQVGELYHRTTFMGKIHNKVIKESKIGNTIKVFHGTKPKFVNDIKNNGLVDKTGYNQGWYMLSTDFESALYHAHPDDDDGYVYVIEFEIPNNESDMWDGYPYLWKGQKRDDKSTWFALMKQIPKEYVKQIHEIDYNKWIHQKNVGF